MLVYKSANDQGMITLCDFDSKSFRDLLLKGFKWYYKRFSPYRDDGLCVGCIKTIDVILLDTMATGKHYRLDASRERHHEHVHLIVATLPTISFLTATTVLGFDAAFFCLRLHL
jgi:hypothetical protein